jgi:hypothetical protein
MGYRAECVKRRIVLVGAPGNHVQTARPVPSLLVALGSGQHGLGGGQSRDWDAER